MQVFLLSSLLSVSVLSSNSADMCNHKFSDKPNYDTAADRVYYIACVEQVWDYAPSGMNLVNGLKVANDPDGSATWLEGNGMDRIGSRYVKALYREYVDSCFIHEKPRTKEQEHLGNLGPIIRAISGETIKIFFSNMCGQPYSLHPHGVHYDKSSEGAPYLDGFNDDGDVVQPGDNWVYVWNAREAMLDPYASSKMWLYHSHVDEVNDVHAGLMGAIIVTKKGFEKSASDPSPNDVTREYVTFFSLMNENESPYFLENVKSFTSLSADAAEKLLMNDPDFEEANLMHGINGYLFGNLVLDCVEGEYVRWYSASLGNEMDGPHTPHWHGNIGRTSMGESTDTVQLLAGGTNTMTMHVDSVGKWLYHCHVNDHIHAGMKTTYTVI